MKWPLTIYGILFFPILIVHEICHLIGYLITWVKIKRIDIKFFEFSIHHRFNRSHLKTSIISLMPCLQPIIILSLLYVNPVFFWVGLYAICEFFYCEAIGMNSSLFPSDVDINAIKTHAQRIKEYDDNDIFKQLEKNKT